MPKRVVHWVVHSNENLKLLLGFLSVILMLLFSLWMVGHFLYRWF